MHTDVKYIYVPIVCGDIVLFAQNLELAHKVHITRVIYYPTGPWVHDITRVIYYPTDFCSVNTIQYKALGPSILQGTVQCAQTKNWCLISVLRSSNTEIQVLFNFKCLSLL